MKLTLKRIANMVEKNNECKANVSWVEKMRTVVYPTGIKGRIGKVRVSAEGFKTKIMVVDQDENGILIH